MSMSRKDYELIAQTISELSHPYEIARRQSLGVDDLTAITNTLAHRFKAANPTFDPARFRAACQP